MLSEQVRMKVRIEHQEVKTGSQSTNHFRSKHDGLPLLYPVSFGKAKFVAARAFEAKSWRPSAGGHPLDPREV